MTASEDVESIPKAAKRKRRSLQEIIFDKHLKRTCGAKTRKGTPCQAKMLYTMKNGQRRCRNHGGLSTGPRTPEGKAKVLENLAKSPYRQKKLHGERA